MNEYDIGKAFRRIENELIKSMIANLKHHKAEEEKEGILWSQWQVEQLAALEQYKKQNKDKFSKEFAEINDAIDGLIKIAREEGNMDQEEAILKAIKKGAKLKKGKGDIVSEFFKVNDRKLDALIKATTDDFKRGEIAILRRANDQYRKIIFDAQVYANAGGTTYEKAVDMATKDFLARGIDCIEYANGSRHSLSDYADMAIKTAVKRAYLTGEGEKRKEWGVSTVILNKRGNPCPKCLPFCGKILIDDVWSGGSGDGISAETGKKYPLMSKAIEAGLYHPRCKDSHTTFFEGISSDPDDTYRKKELEQILKQYEAEQKQNYAKKKAEKFGRLKRYSLDKENRQRYSYKEEQWSSIASRYKNNEGIFTTLDNRKTGMDVIKPHNIRLEMKKSDIGKELLEYLEENNIPVYLYYGVDVEEGLTGLFFEDAIYVYADETKTTKETALTVIHEATHARINKPNTKNQELECFKNEYQHRGIELTEEIIQNIINHINEKYDYLDWE